VIGSQTTHTIAAIGLALTLGLAVFLLAPGEDARATTLADGISVVESKAEHVFAQQATFTLHATSDAEIAQIYLFLRATGDQRTDSSIVPIEPDREIFVTHSRDLRLSPLPPFATISFWWQIDDAAGNRRTTDPQQFEYTDNRFQWEQLGSDGVSVRWIAGQGDPAFGQNALDVARASLREIGSELHGPVPDSVTIHIYDSAEHLDAAMVLAGRNWVGGQAHPELGAAVVAVPNSEGYTARLARVIPHEITHLLVYQATTAAGYTYVPEWLDEGLATANEGLPNPDYLLALENARAQRLLIPLQDLCHPFPPDPETAFLAYAQSGNLVGFIRSRYGAPAIRALLNAYADGASCDGGVQQALGTSLKGLETAWRASLEPQAPWQVWAEQIGTWVGLWLLSLLVAVPMIGSLRRRL
jgi:hypothetical protein